MKVVTISPELIPFSKTGGLADVAGTLPKFLSQKGIEASIITPLYKCVKEGGFSFKDMDLYTEVPIAEKNQIAKVYVSLLPRVKVPVYLIDNDEYFNREGLYTIAADDYKDNCERFTFFCRAALQFIMKMKYEPQVIHCHDWQTALVPVYIKTIYNSYFSKIRCVLSVHNLAYQGLFDNHEMSTTGLDWRHFNWKELEYYGKLNLLKGGIVYSDAVTTVSKRYAQEILTEEFGCGLDGVLRERSQSLHGILNGVDYSYWDPEADKLIPYNYNAGKLNGKARCKDYLQRKCNLAQEKDTPLIGFVGRLVEQKGIDIFLKAGPLFAKDRIQFVILGSGTQQYTDALRKLSADYPEHFSVQIGFDNQLAHEIEAGADMFLMPSRYEPCGLNQIYSMRYGTVPIVRETGGLADTVVDVTTETLEKGTSTGFTFKEYSPEALYACTMRALTFYKDKKVWLKIVKTCMRQDFSWEKSADEYIALYRRLVS